MFALLRNVTSHFLRTSLRTRPVATTKLLTSCGGCTPNLPDSLIKLKRLQAQFQAEDGLPIWLKAGISDRFLYASTVLGCYTGVLMVLQTLYENAKPASWKKADESC